MPRTTLALLAALALALFAASCGEDDAGAGGGEEGEEQPVNARGVPLAPGGDNTIQRYGNEGSEAQREQAATTLTEYAAARDTGDWARACELMSSDLRAELRSLARQSSVLRGESCPTVAELVNANLPRRSSTPPPEGAAPELASFRVKGADAIAIYAAGEDFYFMPFDRDAGEWMVSDLNGEALLEEGD